MADEEQEDEEPFEGIDIDSPLGRIRVGRGRGRGTFAGAPERDGAFSVLDGLDRMSRSSGGAPLDRAEELPDRLQCTGLIKLAGNHHQGIVRPIMEVVEGL